jgi:hypothetical protein
MNPDKHDDVTEALGSAFHTEPPLGIDRTEVMRKGRNRLRQRRFITAGSVAAGVTGIVLGASLLSGFGTAAGPAERIMPAGPSGCGASTRPIPYSGSLTAATTLTALPPTGTTAPAPGSPTPAPPCHEEHAVKLTEVIVGANVVPPGFTTEAAPETPGPLEFFTRNEDYRSVTILRDARGAAST